MKKKFKKIQIKLKKKLINNLKKINANLTFDLETWNIQGQGNRERSRWKELIKVYLHLKCERVIDHGVATVKLNVNYAFDLETWNMVKVTDKGQDGKNSSKSIYI